MKLKKRIREQKGSITLFVLTSMIFFTIVVAALYVNTNYKAQAQQREIEKIQRVKIWHQYRQKITLCS